MENRNNCLRARNFLILALVIFYKKCYNVIIESEG